MSTKVQKFHLSSECRYILYRLRAEIDFQLDKDITDGFPCVTCSLGNLLPLIYVAFIKLWCGKVPLVVKKSARTYVGLFDRRKVIIDYDRYVSLLHDSACYRETFTEDSENLPF